MKLIVKSGLKLDLLLQWVFCLVYMIQQVWCSTQHRLTPKTISIPCSRRQDRIKSTISVKVTIPDDKEELAKIIFSFVVISNLIIFSSCLGKYFIS